MPQNNGQDREFFITTAIDYANGSPHIGHVYEKILADAIARYQRLAGRDVTFVMGTDEHGEKISKAAAREGVTPQELVDDLSERAFQGLWKKLGISYDHIDDYLEGRDVPDAVAERIETTWRRTRHKRTTPVTILEDWWRS